MISRLPGPARRAIVALVAILAVGVLALGIVLLPQVAQPGVVAGATAVPSLAPASGSPAPAPSSAAASASPAASPTPTPAPTPVAAVIEGVLLPPSQAAKATRRPLAVMIDDSAPARPQSGIGTADLVYQAPAEGGIPRYMLVFQAGDASSVGPIRSARLYFAAWASEWRALYAHVGGAPNALAYVARVDRQLLWNADEFAWGPAYMWRITQRLAPHNVYSSSAVLRQLAAKLGASTPFTSPAWTFTGDAPLASRPIGGTISVPYPANGVSYRYNRATNTYLRYVSNGEKQIDAATRVQVAPKNVIVQFVAVGPLANAPGQSTNQLKGRLELGYIGSGRALVFRDGSVIAARWSKASDSTHTYFTYASGPQQGKRIALLRGQTYIQVVPLEMPVTYTLGARPKPAPTPTPSPTPSSPAASPSPSPGAPAPTPSGPSPTPS